MAILSGIHPVAEALRAQHPLERVLVAQGAGGPRLQEIIDLARRAVGAGAVRTAHRARPARRTSAHQGVVALGAARQYADLDAGGGVASCWWCSMASRIRTIWAPSSARRTPPAPASIIIPERRAAGLTDVVAKAAAGALEHLPVVRVTNVNRALEDLKERGFWIYGLDERGTKTTIAWSTARPSVLVLGGEGKGLHEQVRKHCDVLVRIPMAGKISSLNVSVAAGVVLFEWKRRSGSPKRD